MCGAQLQPLHPLVIKALRRSRARRAREQEARENSYKKELEEFSWKGQWIPDDSGGRVWWIGKFAGNPNKQPSLHKIAINRFLSQQD